MVFSAKDLLQQLVQIPSVNPAFSPANSSSPGEAELTNFLQKFFENMACPWMRQPVHPGRDNLVVVLRGSGQQAESRPILWESHQDTVGVAGMKIDPFAATESAGRIWGRGACDVKGGLAAMLAAVSRIQAEGAALQRTILLAFTINEECGFSGVRTLCRLWDDASASAPTEPVPEIEPPTGPLSLDELRAGRPERAIVAEPTSLDVVVAHKGSLRWRCHTHGKAAHTSRPEQGINAISVMMGVIQAIERYQHEILNRRDRHPLCGQPTVCVSTIHGGTGVNTVPDQTVIDIDRRLAPGETPDQAYRELVDFIAQHNEDYAAAIEHEPPTNQSVGLQDDNNRDWAKQIATTARSVGPASRLIGVPYGTDAWALSRLGIPTVVFGPGSIDQAHTDDEWIDIEQLQLATEIFYRLAVGD